MGGGGAGGKKKRGMALTLTKSLSMATNSTRLLPYLVLGGQESVSDFTTLSMLGVTHVVNVSNECKCWFEDKITYFRVPIEDEPGADAAAHFPAVAAFLEDVRRRHLGGERIVAMVHCKTGMSRSSTMVLVHMLSTPGMLRYIATHRGVAATLDEPVPADTDAAAALAHRARDHITLRDALAYIRERRPRASPNPGFMQQLLGLEASLHGGEVSIDLERYKRDRFGDVRTFCFGTIDPVAGYTGSGPLPAGAALDETTGGGIVAAADGSAAAPSAAVLAAPVVAPVAASVAAPDTSLPAPAAPAVQDAAPAATGAASERGGAASERSSRRRAARPFEVDDADEAAPSGGIDIAAPPPPALHAAPSYTVSAPGGVAPTLRVRKARTGAEKYTFDDETAGGGTEDDATATTTTTPPTASATPPLLPNAAPEPAPALSSLSLAAPLPPPPTAPLLLLPANSLPGLPPVRERRSSTTGSAAAAAAAAAAVTLAASSDATIDAAVMGIADDVTVPVATGPVRRRSVVASDLPDVLPPPRAASRTFAATSPPHGPTSAAALDAATGLTDDVPRPRNSSGSTLPLPLPLPLSTPVSSAGGRLAASTAASATASSSIAATVAAARAEMEAADLAVAGAAYRSGGGGSESLPAQAATARVRGRSGIEPPSPVSADAITYTERLPRGGGSGMYDTRLPGIITGGGGGLPPVSPASGGGMGTPRARGHDAFADSPGSLAVTGMSLRPSSAAASSGFVPTTLSPPNSLSAIGRSASLSSAPGAAPPATGTTALPPSLRRSAASAGAPLGPLGTLGVVTSRSTTTTDTTSPPPPSSAVTPAAGGAAVPFGFRAPTVGAAVAVSPAPAHVALPGSGAGLYVGGTALQKPALPL